MIGPKDNPDPIHCEQAHIFFKSIQHIPDSATQADLRV